ncbi:MAG TPA: hypothetical protein VFF64_01020 [Candidatus Eremiobacteraceae bacterium]|nr:hypothetical protein [Candidatus Eremiobacteraceae bacterium]
MSEESNAEPTKKQKQEDKLAQRVFNRVKEQLIGEAENSSGLRPEELTKFVRFMESAKLIAAKALLAAVLAAIYEYFALMGVTDVSPARAVLFCAWLFAVLFVWELVTLRKWKIKIKGWAMAAVAGLLAVCFIGLDHWTVQWKIHHPSDVAELSGKMERLSASIQRITQDKSAPRVSTDQPKFKVIQAVPGYLKLELGYPLHLPLEKPDQPVSLDLYYYNGGSTYVHNAMMKAGIFYLDFHGAKAPLHDEEVQKTLKARVDALGHPGDDDIAPGDWIFNSYDTQKLTAEMIEKMELDTARVYLYTQASWTTSGVADHVDKCMWLQPSTWGKDRGPDKHYDPTTTKPVWHDC